MFNTYLQIYLISNYIYSLLLLSKCQILALVCFNEILTKSEKNYLKYKKNLALKLWVFSKYFKIFLKVL